MLSVASKNMAVKHSIVRNIRDGECGPLEKIERSFEHFIRTRLEAVVG